ncbi:MAG: MBL fold metallo-hydrolase [Deltaproteobacteria bacterium]|nr:MBL fold metallo-hydrolase [Deltaproteobacteria bacterium]
MNAAAPLVRQLALGPMDNFTYLIADPTGGDAAVVDPGWDVAAILSAAAEAGCRIEKILLTHAHGDHAQEAPQLARRTGAAIHLHEKERSLLPPDLPLVATAEGSTIALGSLAIRCLHTPGHTPGSQCFLLGEHLFTGDTLFVDDCGRVDLPGSSPAQMVASLHRLAELPPQTIVWPGHDYGPTPSSTIGRQRVTNPEMR